jgi:UDPglucose 6-dehydrogenase
MLVLTDWDEFSDLDLLKIRSLLRQPLLFDGRNLYNPEQMQALGFFYFSVGRREVIPHHEETASAASEDAA